MASEMAVLAVAAAVEVEGFAVEAAGEVPLEVDVLTVAAEEELLATLLAAVATFGKLLA